MNIKNSTKPTLIEVFSDGSGNTMASDGGYGWRIVVDGVPLEDGSGYLPQATNNVAEITAAIQGLSRVDQLIQQNSWQNAEVVLVADSQLVLGYASGKWRCKAEHLKGLCRDLQDAYGKVDADQRWVRGHNGDENNEHCDKLAKAAREGKGINNA